jgi:hypothetical protein
MGLVSPKTREAMRGAIDKVDASSVKAVVVNVLVTIS